MYRPDPTIPFVAAAREQVVALVESLNQPQISIPGKPPQLVQGHLCGLRNANGTFSLLIGFYLPQTAENVIYAHDPREVTRDEYPAAEAEGLQFLESMGFMLDNLNFAHLSAEQQQHTLQRIPIFARAAKRQGAATAEARPGALARLLAGF